MDLIYLAASGHNLIVGLWCCTIWKERTKQVRFLTTAFCANILATAACFSLRPNIGPLAYGLLYLVAEASVASGLLLVLFSILRELHPPLWTLIVSAVVVLAAVSMLWPGSWIYARLMLSLYGLGVVGAMSCTLASFSRELHDIPRARRFALTALAAFFGTQFATVSGLVAFLLPFERASAVIGALSFIVCWTLLAWGLTAAPSPIRARQFERRIAEAARILGRNLQ